MRTIAVMLSLLWSCLTFAQSEYKGPGKVVLSSGETLTGTVEYQLTEPGKVQILPEGQEKWGKYKSDEVKEFTVNEMHYLPYKVKGGEVKIGNTFLFLRLMVPADFKLKILISETLPIVYTVGASPDKMYYAVIPGDETAYALSDLKFTPFKKMAGYLSDCQVIVDKINQKDKDHFVPLASTDEMKLKIFLNVSNTYQFCQ